MFYIKIIPVLSFLNRLNLIPYCKQNLKYEGPNSTFLEKTLRKKKILLKNYFSILKGSNKLN